MKLCHVDFQFPFQLDFDKVNVLVVENPKYFAKYCLELLCSIQQDSGNFCLFDGEKTVKLSKVSMFVTDVLTLEVENKKVTTKMITDIKNIAESLFFQDVANIQTAIAQLMKKINCESLCQIDYDQDSDISNVFKAFNVKLYQDGDSLLEKLTTFLKVSSRYLGTSVLFFANLKCYLSSDELLALYHEAQLENINLFLLEHTQKDKLFNEKITIIDNDLCEIIV